MKITVHLDLEEVDYIAIVQAANYKRISTEDFIRQAIRKAIEDTMNEMRPTPTQSFQSQTPESEERDREVKIRKKEEK